MYVVDRLLSLVMRGPTDGQGFFLQFNVIMMFLYDIHSL